MTVLDDTLAALPDEFTKPRDIWILTSLKSFETVIRALRQLYNTGKAERTRRVENGFSHYLYRRARNAHRGAA